MIFFTWLATAAHDESKFGSDIVVVLVKVVM